MIIGVTGYAQHGKDSVARLLVEHYGYTRLAFADGVRQMAEGINPFVFVNYHYFSEGKGGMARYNDAIAYRGYEFAKKYEDVRRLLQRIGTEGGRKVFGENCWVDLVKAKIAKLPRGANVVISDVRFPNEAQAVRELGGIVVRVNRPGFINEDMADQVTTRAHASETSIDLIEPDLTINARNMTELELAVDRLGRGCVARPTARIYLAGPWADKARCAEAKQQLQAAGLTVVSGWTERENSPAEIADTDMAAQAAADRDEVNAANTLVILNYRKSDGKASEMGMALAQGKRVVLVGSRVGNIFYHLPEVEQFDRLEDAIVALGGTVPFDFQNVDTGIIGG